MSTGRIYFLIVILGGIALVVVYLRTEQARCAARLLTVESRWIQMRRQRWALQTRAARLRAPQRLYDRFEIVHSPRLSPADRLTLRPPVRLTSNQAQ